MANIKSDIETLLETALRWSTSLDFYIQCGIVILAILFTYLLANTLKRYLPVLHVPPGPGNFFKLRKTLYELDDILLFLCALPVFGMAVRFSMAILQQAWLILIAQSLVVILLSYVIITRFIKKRIVKSLIKWIILPIIILWVFDALAPVTAYLDSLFVQIGHIRISAYGVARLLIFGIVLFWLGRVSNTLGQQIIRNQEELDIGTREVFAKLFEVILFFGIFILLLQLLGINLTALAVFGGALGVGLGFGLQSIASNFISGIIILLDRSIAVGDYIELDNGLVGKIRELNMRSAILETYDGKDVMVPNEQFIKANFINWTHKNKKQRYPLEFTVAYDTDLDLLFKVVRETVASHPKVLSGDDLPIEERPDAEIKGFGDNGIDILVEFWMEGIDDGENRVGADLLYMIWKVLQENNIQIPYPQHEVKILNQ